MKCETNKFWMFVWDSKKTNNKNNIAGGAAGGLDSCEKIKTDQMREASMKQYDYLIVGAGLYGAVFACEAKKAGKRVLVIDRRSHIAGNVYTDIVEDIHVHTYGAHIFLMSLRI